MTVHSRPYRCSADGLPPWFSKTALALALSAFGSGLSAQESPGEVAGDPVIEEVVVTAQKREESLLEVPVAITAVTGEAIERDGLSGLDEVATQVPSFRIDTGATPNDIRITMRGISAATVEQSASPSVGIYVDGIYLGGRPALNTDLLDIQRIEVLRGPQGTLFGRNTAAGALNIVTRKAPDAFEARVSQEVGNYDALRTTAMVGGPLIRGALNARASLNYGEREGYVTNTLGGKLAGGESTGGRLALGYDRGGRFRADLSYEHSEEDNQSNALNPEWESARVSFDSPHDNALSIDGVALTLNYQGDSVQAVAISGFRRWEEQRRNDLDKTAEPLQFDDYDNDSETFSQELRLQSLDGGAFDWLAGLYYSMEESSNRSVQNLTLFTPGPLFTGSADLGLEDRSLAAFGQGSLALTSRWNLTLGGRFTQDRREFDAVYEGFIPGLLETGTAENETDYGVFTGKAAVDYQLGENRLLYASVSQGYKSGGANLSQTAVTQEFDPERSLNYEIGHKGLYASRRLQLGAVLYYIDYQDLQVFLSDPVTFENYTGNAEQATSYGVELESTALLNTNWSVSAAIGWGQAEYDDFAGCDSDAAVPDCDGNQMQNAADLTANLRADYIRPIGAWGDLFASLEANHTGETYFAVTNEADSLREDYWLANARLGIRSADDVWSVSLWSRNLFDETYYNGYFEAVLGAPPAYALAPPRTYGLSGSWRFG